MTLIGEPWQRTPHPAQKTPAGRKLVAARLAQLEESDAVLRRKFNMQPPPCLVAKIQAHREMWLKAIGIAKRQKAKIKRKAKR